MMIMKEILRNKRQYFIDKVKEPLKKAIMILSKRYPVPTKQNTVFPNTHVLLDIYEEFKKNNALKNYEEFFEAVFRVFICEYEHDGYYSFLIDWLYEEMKKRDWKPQKRGFPMYRYWSGTLPPNYTLETNPEWLKKMGRDSVKIS